MKFIVSRPDLCEYTNRIQNIIAPKTPIPILANFMIVAANDTITLTATDLTCSVCCQGRAKVLEEGSTTVPARRFSQLVRELTSSHIEVASDEKNNICLIADSSTFKLFGISQAEFPSMPNLDGGTAIRLKQKDLKDALFSTSFAVSKEDSRYVLTGLFLLIEKGIATLAGTDGKRLAKTALAVDVDPQFHCECIIPSKAIDEIAKNLTQEDDECTLTILNDKIALQANDFAIVTKLLSGDIPNIDKVIPKQAASFVELHRQELMTLLRQISLFTTEQNYSVRFTFVPGELKLNVNTMDVGEGKVSMPVNYDGPRFDIAFNPIFFLDLLKHTRNEVVTMGFSDAFNPGLFIDGMQKESKDSLSPLFVLMPMRLNEQTV